MGRVLIVDDSEIIRAELENILRNAGHTPICAGHGAEGIEQAHKNEPLDLVITDFNMPVMNGVEMTQSLKKEAAFQSVPFIMLTTENSTELRKQGMAAGVRLWIVKPVNAENLTKVIDKLLHSKAA